MVERNKNNAGLLALFTDFLGVHRFWLLRPVSGILYMVPAYLALLAYVTWAVETPDGVFEGHATLAAGALILLLVLFLISLVESIRFFTMHEGKFKRLYLSRGPYPTDVVDAKRRHIEYETDKSKTAAGWLGVLLGWLGIQRFYTGRIGTGLFALLLGLTSQAMIIIGFLPIDGLELDVLGPIGAGLLGLLFIGGLIDGVTLWAMDANLFRFRFGRPVDNLDEPLQGNAAHA